MPESSDRNSLQNALHIQSEQTNTHCRCVSTVTIFGERALAYGYSKDCASALCGPVVCCLPNVSPSAPCKRALKIRPKSSQQVRRLFRTGESDEKVAKSHHLSPGVALNVFSTGRSVELSHAVYAESTHDVASQSSFDGTVGGSSKSFFRPRGPHRTMCHSDFSGLGTAWALNSSLSRVSPL